MPVTLDAPNAVQPGGAPGPMWLVRCDSRIACHNRLYVFAETKAGAAKRAVAEYGWHARSRWIMCPGHRHG